MANASGLPLPCCHCPECASSFRYYFHDRNSRRASSICRALGAGVRSMYCEVLTGEKKAYVGFVAVARCGLCHRSPAAVRATVTFSVYGDASVGEGETDKCVVVLGHDLLPRHRVCASCSCPKLRWRYPVARQCLSDLRICRQSPARGLQLAASAGLEEVSHIFDRGYNGFQSSLPEHLEAARVLRTALYRNSPAC